MAASQDHDYLISTYQPSPAAAASSLVRPAAIVMSRNVQRTSALTYATSQRSAMPVTMKLPQLPSLPVVPRQSPNGDRNTIATCARVREIDPKYKDKKNRPILAYRKDQRYAESRKRDYAQSNRQPPANKTNSADSYVNKGSTNYSVMLNTTPSTSTCRPSTSKLVDNGIKTTTSNAKMISGTSGTEITSVTNNILSSSTNPTGTAADDESLVLRVDGDVKMVVDCDLAAYQQQNQQPKKNKPGRPRKYAEGTKPPRKSEDSDKKNRKRFQKRTDDEQTALMYEITETGLDIEDIGYLRTMFGRYQLDPREDAVVPWGQRIPWTEMVIPKDPTINPQPARLINGHSGSYFADPELIDVVPNASGCARAEAMDEWVERRNLLREIEESHEEMNLKSELLEATPPLKRPSIS